MKGITPYAAGQFTTYDLPAYAEQALGGTSNFALNYAAKDVTASRSELGVRTDNSFALSNAMLILRSRFATGRTTSDYRSEYRGYVPDATGSLICRQWCGAGA